jgi:hypothetical protein
MVTDWRAELARPSSLCDNNDTTLDEKMNKFMGWARIAFRASAMLGIVACMIAGCGKDNKVKGPPRHAGSGKVTFKGAPVPAGGIRFVGQESKVAGVAVIQDGKWTAKAGDGPTEGVNDVEI